MRLIDSEALANEILEEFADMVKSGEVNSAVDKIYGMVINAPTIEERKMGRWIHDGYDHPHGVDWMHCSVCGTREPHVPAAMTNYCPNCGAKMEVDYETD